VAQVGSRAGRSRRAIKLAAQILVLLFIIFGAAELIPAYMLFRVGALHQSAFQPTGLASVYLLAGRRQGLVPLPRVRTAA